MFRALTMVTAGAALAVSAAPASASQSEIAVESLTLAVGGKPSTQGQSAVANHTQETVSVMFLHGDFSS